MRKIVVMAVISTFLVSLTGCLQKVEKPVNKINEEIATFAGGCFWCMEYPFESQEGVIDVVAGYTGGDLENPDYYEVSSGQTGHFEAVQITYDPNKIDYHKLLEIFWKNIDPTDDGGQFVDRGSQYRTAIFYHNERQKKQALASKKALEVSERFKKSIVTQILPFKVFYKAEKHHQDFYKKNPQRYKMYRSGSGRDDFLKRVRGESIRGKH